MNNNTNQRPYYLSASLICGDPLDIKEDLISLEKGKADWLHFDVMDGIFVPRFGLYPELLKSITNSTKIPVEIHMMVEDPEPYVEQLADAGASIISLHVEPVKHLHRVIKRIKDKGVKAGVALNPATSLSVLDYVIDDIDMVVLMAINPGIVGHKLIPGALKKMRDLKKMVSHRPNFLIQVDGGVTFESGPEMLRAGANMLVCGTSTIYKKEKSLDLKLAEFRKILDENARNYASYAYENDAIDDKLEQIKRILSSGNQ